MMGKRSA